MFPWFLYSIFRSMDPVFSWRCCLATELMETLQTMCHNYCTPSLVTLATSPTYHHRNVHVHVTITQFVTRCFLIRAHQLQPDVTDVCRQPEESQDPRTGRHRCALTNTSRAILSSVHVCLTLGVGKSSLVHLLCHGEVLSSSAWTVGCSVDIKVYDRANSMLPVEIF